MLNVNGISFSKIILAVRRVDLKKGNDGLQLAAPVGLEHDMFTVPIMNPQIDKSFASYIIIVDILYRKFVLELTFYRQATDYMMQDIDLSKKTIINWVNTLVPAVCTFSILFLTR